MSVRLMCSTFTGFSSGPRRAPLVRSLTAGALGLLLAFSSQLSLADERDEFVTATRQGALKLLGFYMGPMGGMARGRMPIDADLVALNAQRIGSIAPMLTDTFKLNTAESGVKSAALPVIWEKPAEFQGKIETLIERAADLARIAQSEGADEAAIKGGIGKLGQACGSCHDDFRVKDD